MAKKKAKRRSLRAFANQIDTPQADQEILVKTSNIMAVSTDVTIYCYQGVICVSGTTNDGAGVFPSEVAALVRQSDFSSAELSGLPLAGAVSVILSGTTEDYRIDQVTAWAEPSSPYAQNYLALWVRFGSNWKPADRVPFLGKNSTYTECTMPTMLKGKSATKSRPTKKAAKKPAAKK